MGALFLISFGAVLADGTLTCSDPPLRVEYEIPFYSGQVTCGNLLLESDIGGTHTWIAPKISLPTASDDALYTLM
jgi:hypothetical protein